MTTLYVHKYVYTLVHSGEEISRASTVGIVFLCHTLSLLSFTQAYNAWVMQPSLSRTFFSLQKANETGQVTASKTDRVLNRRVVYTSMQQFSTLQLGLDALLSSRPIPQFPPQYLANGIFRQLVNKFDTSSKLFIVRKVMLHIFLNVIL